MQNQVEKNKTDKENGESYKTNFDDYYDDKHDFGVTII